VKLDDKFSGMAYKPLQNVKRDKTPRSRFSVAKYFDGTEVFYPNQFLAAYTLLHRRQAALYVDRSQTVNSGFDFFCHPNSIAFA
jgi:hypothetical protein